MPEPLIDVTTEKPTAFLDIRLLPWRPRLRRIDPAAIRENVDLIWELDDLAGILFGIVTTIVILVAAPLIAIVIAVVFLPVELWFVLLLGAAIVVARFAGLIPWVVVTHDGIERYRFLPSALRRARELDPERRARVRWHWA